MCSRAVSCAGVTAAEPRMRTVANCEAPPSARTFWPDAVSMFVPASMRMEPTALIWIWLVPAVASVLTAILPKRIRP